MLYKEIVIKLVESDNKYFHAIFLMGKKIFLKIEYEDYCNSFLTISQYPKENRTSLIGRINT